jgi:hypothetical protein
VGAPPTMRSVRSIAAITDAMVRSTNAMITRNRLQASQAQNRVVLHPPIWGPVPKSYCSHSPGSGIHGR